MRLHPFWDICTLGPERAPRGLQAGALCPRAFLVLGGGCVPHKVPGLEWGLCVLWNP